eukprot:11114600-Alexandrium_andersonii.AAC.1
MGPTRPPSATAPIVRPWAWHPHPLDRRGGRALPDRLRCDKFHVAAFCGRNSVANRSTADGPG